MADHQLAKSANRSVLGMANELAYLADAHWRPHTARDLLRLPLRLATTPCGPLRFAQVCRTRRNQHQRPKRCATPRCRRTSTAL